MGNFSAESGASLQLQTKEPVQSVANSVCPQEPCWRLLELGGRKRLLLNSFLAPEELGHSLLCRDEGSLQLPPLTQTPAPPILMGPTPTMSKAEPWGWAQGQEPVPAYGISQSSGVKTTSPQHQVMPRTSHGVGPSPNAPSHPDGHLTKTPRVQPFPVRNGHRLF